MDTPAANEDRTGEALRKLKNFSFSSFLTLVARFGIRLVKNVVFTRLLGPAERGVFGLLTTVPDLIVSLGNLGFGIGNVYLVAHKKYDLRKIVGNTLLFTAVLGIILMAAGYVVLSFKGIIKGDNTTVASYAPLVILMIPFILLQKFGEDLLAAIQRIHFLNMLGLLLSLLPGLFLVALWLITGQTLKSAMFAWAAGFVIVSVWAIIGVASEHKYSIKLSLPYFKESLSFGGRGLIGIFAGILVRKVDYLFVSSMLGAEALGYYAVSVSLAEILLSMQGSVTTPFMSIRLGLETQDAASLTPIVTRHAVFIMGLVSLCVAVGGQLIIILLFGRQFLPSYSAMVLLLPGIVAMSVHDLLKSDLYSHNMPQYVSWAAAGSLLCNLLLNFLLIPVLGIKGAAISSSISYGVATLFLLKKCHALSGTSYRDMLVIKGADIRHMTQMLRKAF